MTSIYHIPTQPMHKVQSYATSLGLKIDKPTILENYYPIGNFDYITFSLGEDSESAKYNFWQHVIDLCFPILEQRNIKLVQLNENLKLKYNNCINLNEKIGPNKKAYVIKGSKLHISETGLDLDLASFFNKDVIFLSQSKNKDLPFWIEPSKCTFLNETEKVENINKIKPEKIASKILSKLGVDFNLEFETVYIGENYNNKAIQFIPDQNTDINVPEGQHLVVRMDKFFNETNLENQLKKHPCIVVTNKVVNLNLLNTYKKHIANVVYFIEKRDDQEFIDNLQSMGVPYILMSYLNEEELSSKKIKYLDNSLINKAEILNKEKIEELKDLDVNSLFYISNGPVLSNFKVFKSVFDYDNKNLVENPSLPSPIKENEEFWKEVQNFHILRKL